MQDSIWFQTLPEEQLRRLQQSDPLPRSVEVVIVGAGIIGISTAYYLAEAGLNDVCVIERGAALGEASGANAGGLWFAQQSVELGSVASLAKTSSQLYDELAGRFEFDLNRSGLLELLDEDEPAEESGQRLQGVISAGFRAEKLNGRSARSLEPGLGVTPPAALFYPDEAHLHPAKLGAALVGHARARGARFCLETECRELRPRLETNRGPLEARNIVIASGAWTPQLTRALGWTPPIKPMRGTLLAAGPLPKTLHHTVVAPNFYYWQLSSGHVGGGGSVDDVGFEYGVDPATIQRIREEMDRLIPAVARSPAVRAWSGFRPYCEDLKPVIGAVPGQERMFVAAGHFKKGIMLAPVTGKILADLITTGSTELEIGPLSPSRFA